MPVIKSAVVENDSIAMLSDKDGALTLEGQVIVAFLESVEFDELMDDADVKEFVESKSFTRAEAKKAGVYEADEEDDEEEDDEEEEDDKEDKKPAFLKKGKKDESFAVVVESLEGEVAAEMVDEDDLLAMFEHYVRGLAEATMEDKALKAAAINLLGEEFIDSLDEASVFKKGDFRKVHSGAKKTTSGKTGGALVKRMMLAMLHKEAIKRVGSGKGYKGGGYDKNGAGYGGGTSKGKNAVALYKGKNKSKLKVASKKVKGGASADAKLKAVAKAKDAKAKAKAGLLAKKKGAGAPEKKSIVAHDDTAPKHAGLLEGADLAGAIASKISNGREHKNLNG